MTSFTARFAGAATLALATLPMVALATAASAAQSASIQVRDLDLSSAAGKAAFESRAHVAARQLCRAEMRNGAAARFAEPCVSIVEAEAAQKMDGAKQAQAAQRTDYATR